MDFIDTQLYVILIIDYSESFSMLMQQIQAMGTIHVMAIMVARFEGRKLIEKAQLVNQEKFNLGEMLVMISR